MTQPATIAADYKLRPSELAPVLALLVEARQPTEAVEHVSERLREDGEGKPLVFRDSLIENIRSLVDVVPRLNIFGDDELARLCEQVKDRISVVDPDTLRPSRTFEPAVRARVKRDADAMTTQFAGYFAPVDTDDREAA